MPRFRPSLSAQIPDGWLAKESLTLIAPDGLANIIASSEPLGPETDLKAYAEAQEELLAREFPGYTQYSFEPMEVLGGGREGFVRRFEWFPPDSGLVMQMQFYYVENGRGYTATATAPSSEFERYEFVLLDVLEGLLLESYDEQAKPAAREPSDAAA